MTEGFMDPTENDLIPSEQWSVKTKTLDARMNARCAGCGKQPGSIDPLPEGWNWDTMEPTNNWLWCPDCPAGDMKKGKKK
jgi:hypothetical protein